MDISATPKEIANWIGEILRADIETIDGKFVFRLKRVGADKIFDLDLHQVEQIITHLSTKQSFEATAIYDDHCYEVLVKEETTSIPMVGRFREDELSKRDEENGSVIQFSR